MFNKHLIVNDKGKEVLYLFIDFNYEFSDELNSKTKYDKHRSIYEKVIDYIKKKRIDFKGDKIFLVVNGIIIGSLILASPSYEGLKAEVTPKYQYVEYVKNFSNPNIELTKEQKETPKEETKVITSTNKETTSSTSTKQNTIPKTSTPKTSTVLPTTPQPPVVQPPAPPVTQTLPPAPSVPSPPPAPVETDKIVVVYRSNGTVEELKLEDYIEGVVAGEMPASFPSEALKTQAVAARTYALKSMSIGKVLTDTVSTQVYKDVNQQKAMWGGSFDTYYNKIKNAVVATKGEYLTYNGKYIDALFYSTSNGLSEDAKAVWGTSYPYLVSVDSHWDLNVSGYSQDASKPITTVDSITGLTITDQSTFEVLTRTPGNRIDTISIDGKIFTGKDLRELFGLRSTDFDIRVEGDNVIFTTRGYGHGVGMSQYGANGMAKEGYSYKDILSHYYPGTILKSI
jgi:stage II sporulation protein D